MDELIVNFDDLRAKRELLTKLGALRGKRRLTISNVRPRRSDRQNAWYFPCIVTPFAAWLTESQGTTYTKDMAHEVLKRTFLEIEVVNRETGEVTFDHQGRPLTRVRHTTELDTAEFSDYCEKCRDMLAETCSILVADPDPDHAFNERETIHARS